MNAIGSSIEQAYWHAERLEALARQYHSVLQIGIPRRLTHAQIAELIEKFKGYGLTDRS